MSTSTSPAAATALEINGTSIRFTDEKLVNLTDLWKAGGADRAKQPTQWIRHAPAQEFINEISAQLKAVPEQLLKSTRGRTGGTFAH